MVDTKRPDFKTDIITPVFRLSYPAVWEAKENKLSKRMEFSIQMLFDKKTAQTDLKEIKALMLKVAQFKWPGKIPTLQPTFKDGDALDETTGLPKSESNPSLKGQLYVRIWSTKPPAIFDAKAKKILPTSQDEIYGGCWAKAFVNVYAWEKVGKFGINLGLVGLQKVKDGESFGGGNRAEDAFVPVEQEHSMADDIYGGEKSNSEMFG